MNSSTQSAQRYETNTIKVQQGQEWVTDEFSPALNRLMVSSPKRLQARLSVNASKLGLMTLMVIGVADLFSTAIAHTAPQSAPPTTAHSIAPRSLHVAQMSQAANTLWVNPQTGNDAGAGDRQNAPFKTITQALQTARPGTIIQLAPGTYSAQSGEQFPIKLKPDITLRGEPNSQGKTILIQGGGFFLSPTAARQNVAVLGANRAIVSGVTITNANPRGYGLWVESSNPTISDSTFTGSTHDGISVSGKATGLIQNNVFTKNGASGISVFSTAQPTIQSNIFENTGFGVNVGAKATPQILKNQIRKNKDGVVVQANGRPRLRDNVIEGNDRDGLVVIGLAAPDLGSSSDPGKNSFRNNSRFDINNSTKSAIALAYGNQVASSRIQGEVNLAGTFRPAAPVAAATPARMGAIARPNPKPLSLPNNPQPLPVTVANRSTSSPRSRVAVPSTPGVTSGSISMGGSTGLPVVTSANSLPAPKLATAAPLTTAEASETASAPDAANTLPPLPGLPVLEAGKLPNGLVPVPKETIPMGNSGEFTVASVPPPPSVSPVEGTSTAIGLRYRVMVVAPNPDEQAKVKSLVPGAFRTSANGRTLMQAGAFGDRAKADEMAEFLSGNGFKAQVERYN
jgi:parallel beta-helix repeat protein